MGGGDAHKTPEGRLFVGGAWRDEREWPLARTVYTPYYLHADGTLTPARLRQDRPHPPGTRSTRATRCRPSAATCHPKVC